MRRKSPNSVHTDNGRITKKKHSKTMGDNIPIIIRSPRRFFMLRNKSFKCFCNWLSGQQNALHRKMVKRTGDTPAKILVRRKLQEKRDCPHIVESSEGGCRSQKLVSQKIGIRSFSFRSEERRVWK